MIFDPSREEIAVADAVLAISVTRDTEAGNLKLLSIRTIDPPSRLTQPAVPNSENVNMLGATPSTDDVAVLNPATGEEEVPGVWRPRRGGLKRSVIAHMIKAVLKKGVLVKRFWRDWRVLRWTDYFCIELFERLAFGFDFYTIFRK